MAQATGNETKMSQALEGRRATFPKDRFVEGYSQSLITVRDAPSGLIPYANATGGLRHRLISISPLG